MIRRSHEKDFERIYQLGSTLHANYKKLYDLTNLINEYYTKIFVSLKDNLVVGFLMITELEDIIDIIDIVVDEKYRNHHIASGLLNYMFDDMSDTVDMVTLEVATTNDSAIHLYQKFGFEIVNKRLFYYGVEDAYLMGRRIIR